MREGIVGMHDRSDVGYAASMTTYMQRLADSHPADSVERTGWTSRATQRARFRVLAQIGNVDGRSLLDVGCNVGDFYEFLQQEGINCAYQGYDLVPDNCAAAAAKHGRDIFAVRNVLDTCEVKHFDYVLASGIFFLDTPNWRRIVTQTLTRMFELARIGIGANFLSGYVKPELPECHHITPEEILDICRSISPIFALRHDYAVKGNDFTLFLYREAYRP